MGATHHDLLVLASRHMRYSESSPGPGVHAGAALLACGLPFSSPPPWDHPTAPSPLSLLHSAPKDCAMHESTSNAVVPHCKYNQGVTSSELRQASVCLHLVQCWSWSSSCCMLLQAVAMVLLLCFDKVHDKGRMAQWSNNRCGYEHACADIG